MKKLNFSTQHLFLLIVLWKVVDVIVSLVAPYFIPYLGFFSYGPTMLQYGMPDFIRALTNFDGIFYIRIAIHGYQLTEQAYFPLYPILLYNVNSILHNPILAGLSISLISFVIGIFVFKKYLESVLDKQNVIWALLFLLAYPTSYYFGVLYNEGLFFLLVVGLLYSLKKKYFWLGMLLAYCASLTKVVGVFLVFPIACTFLEEVLKGRSTDIKTVFTRALRQWRIVLVGVASLSGLASYCFYLWKTLGDPIYFIHAQESFGAHRSSHLITPFQVVFRYFKIFLTADRNFQYGVAVIELLFYLFAMSLICVNFFTLWKQFRQKKKINFDRLGLGIFSLSCILVPSFTGTLTAVPRYTLMSLITFLVLAEIKNRTLKRALLCVFVLLHICFFALFIQGYYLT